MALAEVIGDYILAIVLGLLASGGLWRYLERRADKKAQDAKKAKEEEERNSPVTRLLLGVAHDRIIYLGMQYITRGWIAKDEYEDFVKYLWEPYSEFGGNGLAEKVYAELSALRMVASRGVHPQTSEQETHVPVYKKDGENNGHQESIWNEQ